VKIAHLQQQTFHSIIGSLVMRQRLVTWGDAACGGVLPQDARLPAAVKSIHCTRRAFVAWGDSRRGGDVGRADVRSGVRSVHATRGAFAGLKDDGQVV
ncbi:unnamed protein product, partial [Polarella glacialis]